MPGFSDRLKQTGDRPVKPSPALRALASTKRSVQALVHARQHPARPAASPFAPLVTIWLREQQHGSARIGARSTEAVPGARIGASPVWPAWVREPFTARRSAMRVVRFLWTSLVAFGSLAVAVPGYATPPPLVITTVSTGADRVSGGDVLVRVDVPAPVVLSNVHVSLNGVDVTGAFQPEVGRHALIGLVTGLPIGGSVLRAATKNTNPSLAARLDVRNFPITGPIFSGPHETPFYCMTQNFRIPGSTQTLGLALDADCSTTTRVDHVYRSNGANPTFKALPSLTTHPSDLAQTTTTLGKKVPYIVRVETGTINRAIYQTAVLHDPIAEQPATPFAQPAAWNRRLVYTLVGGCTGGWYLQGSSIGNGGILEDLMLRQGYAVASSTLNVFGNNCNELLAAESLMMVKERFIENFGPPAFTIGYGCSGGSEQAHPIADGYPGLLDGIIVGCSFPEVV